MLSPEILWDGDLFVELLFPFPVGDSSFGRALFEMLLPRMTLRSLEKMPHLQEVFGITVRDSHLQFKYQTATRKSRLKPLWWAIKRGHEHKSQRSHPIFLMFVCVSSTFLFFSPCCDSCFNPCSTPVHLIDISCICIVTRRSIEHATECKYKTVFIWKKASDYACSLSFLNWTELQISLELVRVMVFIQAKKPPGWKHVLCPFSIFTFTTGAELLFQQFPKPDRTHLKTALSKAWKTWDSFTTGINL